MPPSMPPNGSMSVDSGSGPVEFEFGGSNGVAAVTDPTTVPELGFMGSGRLAYAFGLPRIAPRPACEGIRADRPGPFLLPETGGGLT